MGKIKRFICIGIVLLLLFMTGWVVFYYFMVTLPEERKQEQNKRIVQEYYDNKIAIFTEENKTAKNIDIVFLGDSLTDGYNLSEYYPQYKCLNRGIGGDTTFGLYKRLKVSVYDVNPKVCIMLIGANNIYTMFDNYEDILIDLKANLTDTKIVLLSLTAMGQTLKDKNDIAILNNQKIKCLAQKYNLTFVDLFTPLYDEEKGEVKAGYTVDGGHFTGVGYTVVTNTITPYLSELID